MDLKLWTGQSAVTRTLLGGALLAMIAINSGCGGDDTQNPSTGQDSGSADSNVTDLPDTGNGDAGQPVDSGKGGGDTGVPDSTPGDTGAPDVAPQKAAAPTFSPAAGTFTSAQNVTISDTTANATIYYTTDGTNPTTASQVFSSPIAVAQTTTIRAMATANGFLNSDIAAATYTINIPPGQVAPPTPNPASTTRNNDFLLALTSSTSGATICYTLDGSSPTCSAGVCQGTAQTYNAATQVAISGAVTNASGQVTVHAIACKAGSTDNAMPAQTYTLQAAAPTAISPTPGTLPFQTAGYDPSWSSATNGATIRHLEGAGTLTCANGTALSTNPGTLHIGQNTTVQSIACKPNYAPSVITSSQYTVQLGAPTFDETGGTYDNTQTVTVTNPNSLGGGTAGWVCINTAGTTPGCGTTASTCTGTGSAVLGGGNNPISMSSTGSSVDAIACGGSSYANSQGAGTGAFTLQLDPVKFTPPNGSSVPSTGGLSVAMARDTSVGNHGNNSGGADYSFICWTDTGAALDCTCTGTGQHKSDTDSVPSNATTTISAIGCSSAGGGTAFLPSGSVSATYSPVGAMAAPTILPANHAQNNDVQVTFTNNDAEQANVCYTVGTAPADPTCTAGGAVTCISVAPGATSTAGPMVTSSGTVVKAIACDTGAAGKPATQAAPATYTLTAADPAITPSNGQTAYIGTSAAFTTATLNSVGTVQFYYTTNGTTPSCSSGIQQSTINSGTTAATNVGGGSPAPEIMGTEPSFKVIACKTGYLPSNPITASFTYAVAAPVPAQGTGTYFDYVDETFNLGNPLSGITNWMCVNGQSCSMSGSATNGCVLGAASYNGITAPWTPSVKASGTVLDAVTCAIAGGTTLQSARTTATYTLDVSPIVAVPTAGAQSGTVDIQFKLQNTCSGSGCTPPPVTSDARICYSTTQSVPSQPIPCSSFSNAAWTCQPAAAGNPSSVTITDVGTNVTYNAFACKVGDGLVYSTTSNQSYTFTGYSHSITFTGNATDFTDSAELLASTSMRVSYDSSTLYIGFNHAGLASVNGYVHVYLGGDTAPTNTATADTAPFTDNKSGTLPAGAHVGYHLYWKTDDSDIGLRQWTSSSSSWGASSVTPTRVYLTGTDFVELSIPLSAIGTPHVIRAFGGLYDATANTTLEPAPSPNASTGAWTDWQAFIRSSARTPNDVNNLDQ